MHHTSHSVTDRVHDRLAISAITAAPPVLLPELLGVSPHFLLDTIVNTLRNSVEHCRCYRRRPGSMGGEMPRQTERGDGWDSWQETEWAIVPSRLYWNRVWISPSTVSKSGVCGTHDSGRSSSHGPHQAGFVSNQLANEKQEHLAEIDDHWRRIQVVRTSFVPFQVGQFIHSIFLAKKTQEYIRESVAYFCRGENGKRTDFGLSGGGPPEQIVQLLEGISGTDRLEVCANRMVGTLVEGKREWETDRIGYGRWATID